LISLAQFDASLDSRILRVRTWDQIVFSLCIDDYNTHQETSTFSQPPTVDCNKTAIDKRLEDSTQLAIKIFSGAYSRNFQTGRGADFQTDTSIVECKNLAVGSYMTPKWFLTDVLPRFLDSDPHSTKRHVLVLPVLVARRPLVQQLLQDHNIEVVEVYEQVTTNPLQQLTVTLTLLQKLSALYNGELCDEEVLFEVRQESVYSSLSELESVLIRDLYFSLGFNS